MLACRVEPNNTILNLAALSGDEVIDGVRVVTVAIGWA